MKLNLTDFGRKWQFPVMLAMGSIPLPTIVCVQETHRFLPICLVLAAMYVVMAWICIVIPGKLRVLAGILCSAAMVAACIALLPIALEGFMWMIPAMYVVMLMGGLRMGGMARGHELHPVVGVICLLLHVAAQFLVNVDRTNRDIPIYGVAAPILIVCFIGFAAMALLAMNRVSLNNAVNGLQAVPTAMRRKNLLLTAGFFALTLLLAALPAIAKLLEKVWDILMSFVLMLVRFLLSLFPEMGMGGQGGPGGGMEMLAVEPVEQSLLSKIMEKVLIVFALLLAAALAFFLLRIAWKKLKVLLKILWDRLNAYMVSSSEDYVDEVADTREGGESVGFLRRRRTRMLRRRVDESLLNPQERIRYRYLLLWDRHPEWTVERTARENLAEDAALIYERARYSTHEVTEREAVSFAEKTEKRKGTR